MSNILRTTVLCASITKTVLVSLWCPVKGAASSLAPRKTVMEIWMGCEGAKFTPTLSIVVTAARSRINLSLQNAPVATNGIANLTSNVARDCRFKMARTPPSIAQPPQLGSIRQSTFAIIARTAWIQSNAVTGTVGRHRVSFARNVHRMEERRAAEDIHGFVTPADALLASH